MFKLNIKMSLCAALSLSVFVASVHSKGFEHPIDRMFGAINNSVWLRDACVDTIVHRELVKDARDFSKWLVNAAREEGRMPQDMADDVLSAPNPLARLSQEAQDWLWAKENGVLNDAAFFNHAYLARRVAYGIDSATLNCYHQILEADTREKGAKIDIVDQLAEILRDASGKKVVDQQIASIANKIWHQSCNEDSALRTRIENIKRARLSTILAAGEDKQMYQLPKNNGIFSSKVDLNFFEAKFL